MRRTRYEKEAVDLNKILFWISIFAIFGTVLDAVSTVMALQLWPNHFYESVPTSACLFASLGFYQGLAFMGLIKCLIIILFYHTTLPKWIGIGANLAIGGSAFYAGAHNFYLIIQHVGNL